MTNVFEIMRSVRVALAYCDIFFFEICVGSTNAFKSGRPRADK